MSYMVIIAITIVINAIIIIVINAIMTHIIVTIIILDGGRVEYRSGV